MSIQVQANANSFNVIERKPSDEDYDFLTDIVKDKAESSPQLTVSKVEKERTKMALPIVKDTPKPEVVKNLQQQDTKETQDKLTEEEFLAWIGPSGGRHGVTFPLRSIKPLEHGKPEVKKVVEQVYTNFSTP